MAPTLTLQQPKPKSKKSQMPFKDKHAAKFGLRITGRDASSGEVTSCICRFCVAFGREAIANPEGKPKRKRTDNNQCFTTFRTDLYTQHHASAHREKWKAYKALSSQEDQETFVVVSVPHKETMRAHFAEDSSHLRICLRASIVEEIIGELLFDPNDMGGLTRKRVLALFTQANDGNYEVVIKTPQRFSLLVGTVALGSSFRMAARFDKVWELLGSQFSWLVQFAGDLASTFPNTATVESDFSVMGWEKDEYRQSLTDFSLEGVLHAKQHKQLQSISRVL